MPPRRPAPSLRQGIDNEIYTIVLKLLEDTTLQPTVPSLYQAIQKSNSSLKRKPKRIIEDSLERVLSALEDAQSDEEALLDQTHNKDHTTEVNIMNKALTSAWNTAKPAPNNVSPPTDTIQEQPKRKRRREEAPPKKESQFVIPDDVHFEDIGGIDEIVEQMEEILLMPMLKPQLYSQMALPLPRGVLLHGPPGCGKTLLARACAAESGVPLIEILGPSIVSGMSGESEKQVREAFEEAKKAAPCILFIDEIDVIAPKRESAQSQMEKRIVAQLLISMDSLALKRNEDDQGPVIVLAATNRPDSLDPALRRGGRFDTEINMGVPDERTRAEILRALTKDTLLADDVDFSRLARMTPGFVGADLRDLVGKAGAYTAKLYRNALKAQADISSINGHDTNTEMDVDSNKTNKKPSISITNYRLLASRLRDTTLPEPPGFSTIHVTMSSFLTVLPLITPSSKREGFATIPDTTWSSIGALQKVREELQVSIIDAIKYPERYKAMGMQPAGVLLWGPPGCGKTLLAKAVANESKANFISVKGPELLNKFVGESERALRTVFTRARSSIPCVIFFDELDALVPRRDEGGSGNEASARVVNTLLTELDGLASREGIYVIAATNRPDIIDDAMLRPGRLETLLFVDLPGADERAEILCALVNGRRKTTVIENMWPENIFLGDLAKSEKCKGFSGADLDSLVRRAAQTALRRKGNVISQEDFVTAVGEVVPSVTGPDKYHRMKMKFRGGNA